MSRVMDCVHPAHDDIHFTAEDDEDLFGQVQRHRDEHHPEMSDDDIREVISANARDA